MPIANGLETEFEGRVAVIRLNAEDEANATLLAQYGLRGHPSFVVLDADGRVVQTFFGPQTVESLREAMTAVSN